MKRCPPLRFLTATIAVMLVSLFAVSGYAQMQSGNIFGKVQAKDGSPLPGVTVTLTGVGAPATFVTDNTGAFRFLNLSPGTYALKAELAGFGTSTRQGIGVNIGRNADVTMTLNPAAAESITVTAEAPLLDVRKAGTGATVTKVELEKVPTGRDPWVILQQTPGVLIDRINVGGNESGQQSNYVGKGTTSSQSTWNVDGVNITDVGALGSSPTYYDFDSFEEMQVTTGGTDVRIQTPGVQLNMVTKRGTNDVKGSGRIFETKNAWQAEPAIPAEAQSYLYSANEINKIDDYGVEAGGPIVRDRLWVWGAYARQQVNLLQPSGLQAPNEFLNDKTALKNYNLKINSQILPQNSFSFAGMLGNKEKIGRNAGPTRPKETAWNQKNNYGGPTMWKVEDTHIFGPSFYLTGLYSKVKGGFQLIADNGQGCTTIQCGLSGLPTLFDFSNPASPTYSLPTRSYYSYYTERPQTQYRADTSSFFNTGTWSHELKIGAGVRKASVRSLTAFPQNQVLVYYETPGKLGAAGGVSLSRMGDFTYKVDSTDAYVGDTMMLGNLTLTAGARYDQQKGSISAGSIPGNAAAPSLLPSISYAGSSTLTWNSISPRIGLTYNLGTTRKTLLRAAANRYVDQMGGYEVYGTSPLGYQYIYMYFNDLNGDKVVQQNELQTTGGPFGNGIYAWAGVDPTHLNQPFSTRRWDKNLKAPHTDELMFGVEQEVMSDLAIGVNATYRKLKDFVGTFYEKTQGAGDYYTSADYAQAGTVSGTLPNGQTYTIPYYDVKAGVAAPLFTVFRNSPDYWQVYKGLEFTATKRMSNRWMMRGNITLQDWTQHIGPDAIVDPTRVRTGSGCSICNGGTVVQGSGTGSGAKGGVFINSKWAYNFTGVYQVPVIETSLGFNLTGRQGYPIPYVHRVTGTSTGNKFVLITDDVDTFRHKNLTELDLRAAKDIRLGRAGVTFSVDAFNVLNKHTILQRNTQLYRTRTAVNAAGNRITELQSPRVFRLGARFTF